MASFKNCHQNFSNLKRRSPQISQVINNNDLWIEEIFNQEQNPEDQISLIIKKIEVKPSYEKNIHEVCKDLERIVRQFFKREICVEPFGSGITGLALEGSDIDLFLNFKDDLPDEPKKLLKLLQKIIAKKGLFFKPFSIYARVPVLQCVHVTGIHCDITFLNRLGVANSNLIKFLLSLDKRIRPFCLLLKYIFKRNGLLGKNAITSFTLVNLIIYFLQQLEKPLLSPVKFVQDAAPTKKYIDDWNASFASNLTFDRSNHNHSSIPELLEMFFKFYSTFEFGFFVVSCFAGKSYLKTAFKDLTTLPQEFSVYRENVQRNRNIELVMDKFMCVQDPFDHSNNISRNVTQKVLLEFQKLCQQNSVIFDNDSNKANSSSSNSSNFLKELLLKKTNASPCKKSKEAPVVLYVGCLSFKDVSIQDIEELRRHWSEIVFNKLTDILVKILKCEVKTEAVQGDYTKCFECELGYLSLVSKKRRTEARNSLNFAKTVNIFSQEESISNYLLDTLLRGIGKSSFKFNITCNMEKEPTCIFINFESLETVLAKKTSCLTIFSFLEHYCPIWLQSSS